MTNTIISGDSSAAPLRTTQAGPRWKHLPFSISVLKALNQTITQFNSQTSGIETQSCYRMEVKAVFWPLGDSFTSSFQLCVSLKQFIYAQKIKWRIIKPRKNSTKQTDHLLNYTGRKLVFYTERKCCNVISLHKPNGKREFATERLGPPKGAGLFLEDNSQHGKFGWNVSPHFLEDRRM